VLATPVVFDANALQPKALLVSPSVLLKERAIANGGVEAANGVVEECKGAIGSVLAAGLVKFKRGCSIGRVFQCRWCLNKKRWQRQWPYLNPQC